MRSRLTYANLVATLALFIALGGGAYAASQLPKNSVATDQLRKESVTAGKLASGSVNGPAIGDGLRKLLNEPGPTGPTGPQGEPGAQGRPGPSAVRLHFSKDATEDATPQPVGTVAGLTLEIGCKVENGETQIVFGAHAEEGGTIQENFQ